MDCLFVLALPSLTHRLPHPRHGLTRDSFCPPGRDDDI